MSMDNQTLKLMNDGTQIATVEIPTAVVTDEQLTSIIQSKIDDGSLSALSIKDGSVSNVKLSAIGQQRINLLNINTSTSGKKINKFNYIGDNADYDLSDYIEIELNTLYYVIGADTRSIQYCLYDNSKKFVIGGAVTFVGGSCMVFHNNILKNNALNHGDEVQNSRIWLNQFTGKKSIVNIKSKTDIVFSQNYFNDGAKYNLSPNTSTKFKIHEFENEVS